MTQLLMPIFMLVASIGLYFGFIDPTYQDALVLKDKKAEFDTAMNNANQLSERRQALVDQVNKFPAEELVRLNKLLPDHVDNVRLIMEVDRIALKYGMSIRDVQLQGLNLLNNNNSGNTSTVLGTAPKDYDNVVLSFSVSSSYSTFKEFLSELEDNLRISDVESLSFSVPPQDTRGKDVYQYSLSIRTYWLK
ncbi:MAG: hypothetical protein WC835_02205 [Candidatus Paceibacterota bacterium]